MLTDLAKRLAIFAGLLFLFSAGAVAQPVMQSLPGWGSVASGGGPGTVTTFAWWWGLRPYSPAQIGANAIQLCAQTDTTCASPETETVNASGLVLGAIGSACNNSTDICLVKTVYDQTGGSQGNATGVTGHFPTFQTGCIGSKPCIHFNGSSSYLETPVLVSVINQPITLGWIAERTATFTTSNAILCMKVTAVTSTCDWFANVANSLFMWANTNITVAGANDTVFHTEYSVYNNATTPGAILDGTATTLSSSPGATGCSAGTGNCQVTIGIQTTGSPFYLTGNELEGGYTTTALTAGQGAALHTDAQSFYPSLP